MSEYQEEVLTGLLDLQAELRGDEPEPHDEPAAKASSEDAADAGEGEGSGGEDTVAVSEGSVTVSLSPGSVISVSPTKGLSVNERLAALNQRLAQLEYDLAGVTKRIERIEPDPDVESSGTTDADVDARWRSFLDLQKIVADRLDQR
jgi:hypothetical protein